MHSSSNFSSGQKKRSLAGYFVGMLIPVALISVFYLLSSSKEKMEHICAAFSTPVLNFLGRIYSSIPVSIMEIFIILAAVFIAAYIWKLISAMLTGVRPRILILIRYLLILITALAWVWNCYCWLWNTGYYGYSFAEKSGLETEGISSEELYSAAEFFLGRANELSYLVPRNSDDLFSGEFEDFAEEYDILYTPLDKEFPFLAGQTTKPKAVYFSKIMSMTGFTGIFFPLSGETYINTHQPAWGIPDTISHEIAHQRGVHLEAEANFTGIAASIQSDSISYQYSGYVSGLIHLMNALYKSDPGAWRTLRGNFSPGLEADWTESSRYWSEMEGTVSKVTDSVYDTFLKVNTQPLGLLSYGACVDMLVVWLHTSPYSPMT